MMRGKGRINGILQWMGPLALLIFLHFNANQSHYYITPTTRRAPFGGGILIALDQFRREAEYIYRG